ncbi:tetratricopeptide repeat protein [Candidatus Palauibacter sp.]|uniref:tetratricopeptide repeat protein n=1 Tax=Candidatus Palauibacter sp. TaxID=3101350 RepID=UPI003AF227C5
MATEDHTEDHTEEIRQLLHRGEVEPRTHTFARLAELYREDGALERALSVVRRGLASHPHYLAARLVHARVLRDLGRASAARTEYQHVLTLDAQNPAARAALDLPADPPADSAPARRVAVTRWLARLDAAWRAGRRGTSAPGGVAGQGPRGLDTATLATLYAQQGLFDRAIGVYERMLARDPGNTRLASALAETRRRASDADGPPPRAAPIAPAPAVPASDVVSIRVQLRQTLDAEAPAGSPAEGSWRAWLARLDHPE